MAELSGSHIPKRLLSRLQDIYRHSRAPHFGALIWEEHLAAPERQRLGESLEEAWRQHRGPVGMWMAAKGVGVVKATIEIGRCLNFWLVGEYEQLLKFSGETSPQFPGSDAAQSAAGQYTLVLVEHPRQLFWRGAIVEVNWGRHSALWNYLVELVDARKNGRIFDRMTLGGRDANAASKLKHRLSLLPGIPIDLVDRITSAGRGTQQLDIPLEQIHMINRVATD